MSDVSLREPTNDRYISSQSNNSISASVSSQSSAPNLRRNLAIVSEFPKGNVQHGTDHYRVRRGWLRKIFRNIGGFSTDVSNGDVVFVKQVKIVVFWFLISQTCIMFTHLFTVTANFCEARLKFYFQDIAPLQVDEAHLRLGPTYHIRAQSEVSIDGGGGGVIVLPHVVRSYQFLTNLLDPCCSDEGPISSPGTHMYTLVLTGNDSLMLSNLCETSRFHFPGSESHETASGETESEYIGCSRNFAHLRRTSVGALGATETWRIDTLIASKRKALNWRAVLPSIKRLYETFSGDPTILCHMILVYGAAEGNGRSACLLYQERYPSTTCDILFLLQLHNGSGNKVPPPPTGTTVVLQRDAALPNWKRLYCITLTRARQRVQWILRVQQMLHHVLTSARGSCTAALTSLLPHHALSTDECTFTRNSVLESRNSQKTLMSRDSSTDILKAVHDHTDEYTTFTEVDLKQAFQKCSVYREQLISMCGQVWWTVMCKIPDLKWLEHGDVLRRAAAIGSSVRGRGKHETGSSLALYICRNFPRFGSRTRDAPEIHEAICSEKTRAFLFII
ncbi:hypothetical protein PR048_000041 [Dryococelus australis]|uniref:Uncharacterized protein n=1 Tax=Dryococelus australis TaxID=614101 RepID=A0ABQ9IDI5_9NEOP|nr:hypothetical protein PR048_000041 [Dryococelus australis]